MEALMNKHDFYRKNCAPILTILIFNLFIYSCETMQPVADVATQVGVMSGKIDNQEAGKIQNSIKTLSQSVEDFTPEQEYYIGRSVAANILLKYKPYDNQVLTNYLNLIGKACSLGSTRPETFGGYHFLALDSDEINAFAAPGGLIFLTKGLLQCCQTEDEVAAVIAHEISHVQYKHGLQAIRQDRLTKALTTIAQEALQDQKTKNKELADLFDGSIKDITTTLITNGYSQSQEFQADQGAMSILGNLGYSQGALIRVLQTMEERFKPGGLDFFKTHPAPERRISEISQSYAVSSIYAVNPVRQKRFLEQAKNNY
jgi:beta-barrel assembly-enhancing protease